MKDPRLITESQKEVDRDFGLLKVHGFKLPQSQAKIIKEDEKSSCNFNRLEHDKLFKIIEDNDISKKRNFSKWYTNKNGMYSRAVRYISDIYKFDYMIYPNIELDAELEEDTQKTILKKFNNILEHFDSSPIQLICRKWSQIVCTEGCYYGYICDDINDKFVVQDLPVDYCRSRFYHLGLPLVEFNVKYFDSIEEKNRERVLRLFPEEFQKGYNNYRNERLKLKGFDNEELGWIILDVNRAFKFNFLDNDVPPFISAIPALIELEEVQDIEKEKLLQEIQKILVQTFDLDKNGQIPFTVPELQKLNQNAVDMVGDAVGISVLSTLADVHLEDLAPVKSTESTDRINTAENNAYNHFGISTNLFNTDGNLSLDKSIIIDEAFAKPMLLQFEFFFNRYLDWKFNKKNYKFRMKMLTTSIFNYKEMSNSYKDLTKLGFSRFLPMIALGHTQKEVISLAKIEQQILQLDAYMLPPFSSNTMSSDTWSDIKTLQEQIISGDKNATKTSNEAEKVAQSIGEESTGGRPQLPDDKKSDKTIANMASK